MKSNFLYEISDDGPNPGSAFRLGIVAVSRREVEAISYYDLMVGLALHSRCLWGDVSERQRRANNRAFAADGALVSRHRYLRGHFEVATSADRTATSVRILD